MIAVFCKTCGASLREGVKFCESCGTPTYCGGVVEEKHTYEWQDGSSGTGISGGEEGQGPDPDPGSGPGGNQIINTE